MDEKGTDESVAAFDRMTDDEIHAIWLYLLTLPRKESGQL